MLLTAVVAVAFPAIAQWKRINGGDLYPSLEKCTSGNGVCEWVADRVKPIDATATNTEAANNAGNARVNSKPAVRILEEKNPAITDKVYCMNSKGHVKAYGSGCSGGFKPVDIPAA